jgi:uncharacterized protein (DUF3084 family)
VMLLALMLLGASRVLGFWAFLVLLGGILAHFGDHLGTVVGKKRLSLIGLRPKYTAILVNFTTGAFITLSALLGAMLISAEYREALLGVQEKKAEQEKLTRANEDLSKRSKDLETSLASTQGQLKKTEADLHKADETRQQLAREIEELTQEKDRAVQLASQIKEKKESGSIAVTKGSPLIRRPLVVPFDVSRAELKVKLLAMLTELRETVSTSGVEVPVPKADRVDRDLVGPIHDKIQDIKSFYEGGMPNPSGVPAPTGVYIRPLARMNLSEGEALTSVHFEVLPNLVIFAKGEEIARNPLNGKLAAEKLLQQLFNFDTTVQQELRKRGVLEEALQLRLGRISAELMLQFVKIVQIVRDLDRWVTVRLVATSDINAYGEINTSYQILEAGASPSPAPAPSATPGP